MGFSSDDLFRGRYGFGGRPYGYGMPYGGYPMGGYGMGYGYGGGYGTGYGYPYAGGWGGYGYGW